MLRTALAVALAALVLTGPPSGESWSVVPSWPSRSGPAPAAPVTYSAPVPGPLQVVRPFEPPPGPYAAGHRGVDLATTADGTVRAAGDGVVSFAGPVAGRGVVVVVHPDGVSTEYEPVTPTVRTGAAVSRGEVIAQVHGLHGTCARDRCLHWGARRARAYFDPLQLLRPLGPVRLLPWTA